MGKGGQKRRSVSFSIPSSPARVFSPSHQPTLALLARSHALRFVLVHHPQEKPVEEVVNLEAFG